MSWTPSTSSIRPLSHFTNGTTFLFSHSHFGADTPSNSRSMVISKRIAPSTPASPLNDPDCTMRERIACTIVGRWGFQCGHALEDQFSLLRVGLAESNKESLEGIGFEMAIDAHLRNELGCLLLGWPCRGITANSLLEALEEINQFLLGEILIAIEVDCRDDCLGFLCCC